MQLNNNIEKLVSAIYQLFMVYQNIINLIQILYMYSYSRGSKSELGKPNATHNQNVLKVGNRMVPISNVRNCIHVWSILTYGPDHPKTEL